MLGWLVGKNDIKFVETPDKKDKEGEPMYTIIGANGKERNTTLRDAKNNWHWYS